MSKTPVLRETSVKKAGGVEGSGRRSPEPSAGADEKPPPASTIDPRLTETVTFPHRDSSSPDPNDTEHHDDLVGEIIGQYILHRLVGRGTMGRVYRAEHLGLGRPCAIKVLNPGLVSQQPKLRERFWAEARAAAHLLHPNVVTIHNLGTERGFHYIEMEYVSGGVSLQETIMRDGPLESVRATSLVRQVALALSAAHHSGLVHRDVKPANVLINPQGLAKLADFGLVRRASELIKAGVPVAGTPTYMAPELFEGVPASHCSDIYAVGVMFYYLLSARLPFTSDEISDLILKHRFEPIPDLRSLVPEIPDVILPVIDRCLAKRYYDRYDSAEELATDLERILSLLRDTESLIREGLEGIDGFIQGARDHYRILVRLPRERLQEVYVERTQGQKGEGLISVFSVCGPAEPRHYEYALRLNDHMTYGSLSIRNVNGQAMFVMSRTFASNHVSAADIRAAVREVARRGDRVEQLVNKVDMY